MLLTFQGRGGILKPFDLQHPFAPNEQTTNSPFPSHAHQSNHILWVTSRLCIEDDLYGILLACETGVTPVVAVDPVGGVVDDDHCCFESHRGLLIMVVMVWMVC